ncbi:MAG: tRNA (adenosine(37)-N6)-threonylcarbamoyltransferase complex dimerization subunit type 1 TsaB [Burkholderiales bacterium]
MAINAMNILALDTSGDYCSLALWLDGEVISREERAQQNHSEVLLPLLDTFLRENKITLDDLDGIAFGAGPGSFTGLRIACGVAQGLAFAKNLPLAGICTLQALAQAMLGEKVIACLDARMGEIYHATYEKRNERWHAIQEPGLCLPQQAPLVGGDGWIACGNGFAVYAEKLQQRYHRNLREVFPDSVPRAREMAQLAVPVFERGEGCKAEQAAPLYLRNKVALKTAER